MVKHPQKVSISIDGILLALFLVLIATGLVMVASSSMVISDKQYGYPFHYLVKQSVFVLSGLCAAWVIAQVSSEFWCQRSLTILGLGIVLLIIVLIPGLGRVINGSRRWLNLVVIGFQVSELVKLCAFIYLASYVVRFRELITQSVFGFVRPLILLGVMAILLLLQPDFGALVVITTVFMGILFLAGARILPFLILIALVGVLFVALAVLSPYRLMRLTTFLHPWQHAFSSGYQLTQSLIAFGRGGLWGVGLGNSIQKMYYLPEAHTDFIFAVIFEELGLAGSLVLLSLYVAIVWRIILLGKAALDKAQVFSGFFCYAIGLWIAFQVFVNVGVCTGLLPTKGLTLPFVSYGGSSVLVNCLVIGLLMRISYEVRTQSTRSGRAKIY
jgi:cell division protein FtsW